MKPGVPLGPPHPLDTHAATACPVGTAWNGTSLRLSKVQKARHSRSFNGVMLGSTTFELMKTQGFTLIELLVVIGVTGILAGLLLPGLASAKERTKGTLCINNFRQIGFSIELYRQDDRNMRFPSGMKLDGDRWKPYPLPDESEFAPYALGGRDPKAVFANLFPSASHRALYPYLKPSELFHCPRDAGQRLLPWGSTRASLKPSLWETVGCSYQYNCIQGTVLPKPPGRFKLDADGGLENNSDSWVPNPTKFILLYEPPARPYGYKEILEWYQWHRRGKVSDIGDVKKAPSFFYSPTLYVDGHAQMNNFSRSLQEDPGFPYEETKDWMWYKPKRRD